jgi:hypothetical protein
MILKLKKDIYNTEKSSFNLTNEFNEVVAIVTKVRKGFHVKNRHEEEIANIVFQKESAKLEANDTKSFLTFTHLPAGGFSIEGEGKYSVWGKPETYSYDIYSHAKVAATITTYVKNPEYVAFLIDASANALKVLLIVLAIDYYTEHDKSLSEFKPTANPKYFKFDFVPPNEAAEDED